jgi:DNA processing protein
VNADHIACDERTRAMLRLTLADGLGPVLLGRLLEYFGSPQAVLSASPAQLERVKGLGPARSRAIAASISDVGHQLDRELELIQKHAVRLLAIGTDEYPPALLQIPDPPPLLYVRGSIDHTGSDRYPVAIVGSRECTHYGLEQAGRFAAGLASAGLTVVSGGARGIDTAAHRGALNAGGRTIAVLGCGLSQCYPPENAELFERVVGEGRGAVVGELPMSTPPKSENFPARNRIISGLSLGVLVVEAGPRSGSLITARLAGEDHGREVMALPGRVDSIASKGTNELIKAGGASIVTDPADVIDLLHAPGRRHHEGHEVSLWKPADPSSQHDLTSAHDAAATGVESATPEPGLTERQQSVITSIGTRGERATIEQLADRTGIAVHELRSELTILELRRSIRRAGSAFERAR